MRRTTATPRTRLGGRIAARRAGLGMTQQALADRLGLSRQAIALWETGESTPRGARLGELLAELRCSASWLVQGIGQPEPEQAGLAESPLLRAYSVPVVGWDALANGGAHHGDNGLKPGAAVMHTTLNLGKRGFAVTAIDDSMLPDIPPGTTLVCERRAPANPGDYVIVSLGKRGPAVVRRLVQNRGRLYGETTNPAYKRPPTLIRAPVRLVAVVCECVRQFPSASRAR